MLKQEYDNGDNDKDKCKVNKCISGCLPGDMQYLNNLLDINASFDLVYRTFKIGSRDACMYFIDGFCKDDIIQKILQYFMDITPENTPENVHDLSKQKIPYVEVDLTDEWQKIIDFLLSGVFVLLVDGYDKAVLIDSRTYPARSVAEPEKDKVLRGSRDGFVETIVFNTALIRRRIRSPQLHMEMMSAGKSLFPV